MAVAAAALLSPSSFLLTSERIKVGPNKLCFAAEVRTPSPCAAFPPNSCFTFPSLALTASPRLNPRHPLSAASRPSVSCFLSLSSLPLLSSTPAATDPSTARTVAAAVSVFVQQKIVPYLSRAPTTEELARLGAFSLAAIQHVLGLSPSGSAVDFRAPLLALAGAASKWVGLYSEILMVVCLLSWFPNMPWDRQPLSAMRDLTDPYMRLFRGIVPPVFGTMDISSLFGFALLGVARSILNTGAGGGGDGGM